MTSGRTGLPRRHLGVALNTVAHSKSLLCTAVSLRDDFRAYLPELLPRFIGLFAEAERSGNYDQVPVLALSPSSPSPLPSRSFVMAPHWPCIAWLLHILLLVHPLCLPTVLLWLLIGLALLAHSPSCPFSVPPHCFTMAPHWPCIAWSLHILLLLHCLCLPAVCPGFCLALHCLVAALLTCFKQFVYKFGDDVPRLVQCRCYNLKLWVCGYHCMLLCLLCCCLLCEFN